MRLFCIFSAAVAVCSIPLAMKAEKSFSFESTPGKLPKQIVPEEYSIRIAPDVDKLTFAGSESIKLNVRAPQREIVLNALEIEVASASVDGKVLPKTAIQVDRKQELLKISLADKLVAGKHELELRFSGKINQGGFGLYYARYQEQGSGADKLMLGTQFEATDARRLFPCWDEPAFRARFQLTAVVPPNWTAISNMPVEKEATSKDGKEKEVRFGMTPPMASYLNLLVAGELDSVETTAHGVHLRVVTTKGKAKWGKYALESSARLLDYYNEYFGVPYPLPKLDQIAVPGGFGGAMENWGAITYFESALLFDPEKNSENAKQDIFSVLAHEMAHMWFGDLVTMAWWDDLWLNEGFASWMGTKATAFFNPQWEVWLRRGVPRNPMRRPGIPKEQAMESDARKTTHSIQQPVTTEAEANSAFDEITYLKGQSFIRMLENYLGDEAFRSGIRKYISDHKYSNATTADLWQALAQTSGKPIEEIAAAWVHQPGFPLIDVAREGDHVQLKQEHMTVNFKDAPGPSWPIPLTYEVTGQKRETKTMLFRDREAKIDGIPESAALKLNVDGAGNYRVRYDERSWSEILRAFKEMSVADRVNLLGDQWALFQAGLVPWQNYAELVRLRPSVNELAEVEQIIGVFESIDLLLDGSDRQSAFRDYARKTLRPTFDELGWDAKPGEPPRSTNLRASVITALGDLGDAHVKAECAHHFTDLSEGKKVAPDMRRPILLVTGQYADEKTWNKLHELGLGTVNIGEKQDFYEALARAGDAALIKRTLQISLTNELSTSRAIYLVGQVARYSGHPELAWDFARENMDALTAKLDALGAQSFLPGLFLFFSDPARIDELNQYAKAHPALVNPKEIAKAIDEIEVRAELRKRLAREITAAPADPGWQPTRR